jgi:hypothetical protein
MMSIEQALAQPGPMVAAWNLDLEADGTRALAVYDVSKGMERVAWRKHAEAEVPGITEALAARGVVTGRYDSYRPLMWRSTGDAVEAWNEDGLALQARDGVIIDAIDRRFPVSALRAIVGYVEEDMVDRGIQVELLDGKRQTVVYQLSAPASADPTYNRNDLLMDSGWVSALGRELAGWARLPWRDEI